MAGVTLNNVDKIFPGGVHAVRNLSLAISDGEFVVLVGPSGCGKSTVLRLISGLEQASSGEIRIGTERVDERPPQERDVAMVFQNYALYPHKTVRGNLEFPLRMMGVSKGERKAILHRVALQLGLVPLLEKYPRHLSGGQRQRVAMGRAMVRSPQVFLLDEPLSNLDAMLRVRIRAEIARLQQELGVTTVYVTHDQVEAMTLGHRVAVLSEGQLQQVGTGRALYERPANLFVAGFIGSPRMNVFRTRLRRGEEGDFAIELGGSLLSLPHDLASSESLKRGGHEEVFAGLRPEAFSLVAAAPESASISGKVRAAESLGHESIMYVETPLEPYVPPQETPRGNDAGAGRALLVVRLPGRATPPGPGETVSLHVAGEQLHLFDSHGRSLHPDVCDAAS